jgi:hypothetical protein
MDHAILCKIIVEEDPQLGAGFGADDRPEVIPGQILHGHA